jgi:hypothetical protein
MPQKVSMKREMSICTPRCFFENFRYLKKNRWWGIYSHEPKWVFGFQGGKKTLQQERYEPTGASQQFFTILRGVTNMRTLMRMISYHDIHELYIVPLYTILLWPKPLMTGRRSRSISLEVSFYMNLDSNFFFEGNIVPNLT